MSNTTSATGSVKISLPAPSFTPRHLKSLVFLLYARQEQFTRMIPGLELNIPESLIRELKEHEPTTLSAFEELLDDNVSEGLRGFDFRYGVITMDFPPEAAKPKQFKVYSTFLGMLVRWVSAGHMAKPVKVQTNDENEKFMAHTFLRRIGYVGEDFRPHRLMLASNLHGQSGFPSREKYEQFYKKRRTSSGEEAQARE